MCENFAFARKFSISNGSISNNNSPREIRAETQQFSRNANFYMTVMWIRKLLVPKIVLRWVKYHYVKLNKIKAKLFDMQQTLNYGIAYAIALFIAL